jgi:glycosyltransferase involved in cell wall biosynthesis/pyruvate-formate lyase-activating enzyme
MDKEKNLVSIGMPIYNGERFLKQALDSLLLQNYRNFELIISDNGSTDGTKEICEAYLQRDHRIQYHRNNENKGARYNFRKVLSLASGKYFLWAADHDLWDPKHISSCVEILEKDKNVVLCYPKAQRIDAKDNFLGFAHNNLDTRGLPSGERYLRIIRELNGGDPIYGVMRTEEMKKVNISTLWAGDQARLAELSLMGAFAHIPEPLFYWRKIRNESLELRKKTVPVIVDPVYGQRLIEKELPELWHEFGKDCISIIERSTLSKDEKTILKEETKRCFTERYQVDWKSDQDIMEKASKKIENPKKVLLATSAAPSQAPFSTFEKRPPIGIGFLLSILREAGHEIFFIDNYLKPNNFLENDYLQKHHIDFIGIYANTICFRDTRRMLYGIEYLRRIGKWNGKIIVGGPHTSVSPETIPDFVDFVVQGEGEQAILDIVEGRAKERIVKCKRINELDELPMPAWDFFIHEPYNWGGEWFPEKPVFTMNTSRGCPFHCKFCSVSSIWGRKYTCFSAERIVDDIKYLISKYNAKGIYFREDNFTVNRKRTEKFCNLLLEKGIEIAWACETRVDSLDRELVALMKRAGLCALYFGVESGSQKILDYLNKNISTEQTKAAFRYCHEFGVNTAASIIVGVPGETADDLRETMILINEIQPTVTWTNVFVGIPRSPMYMHVLENKLHEFIDDRGLVYLKGHNQRVKQFYNGQWDAEIPICRNEFGEIDNPDISVVMSVYNCTKYLESAIQSILEQTYGNFEFIIVNDGSTDNIDDILNKFDDCRIRVINNTENLGLARSLNVGIKAARGKYIARMDADDLSIPHRFEKQIEFLEKNPSHAMVGSSYYVVDESGKTVAHVDVLTDSGDIKKGLIKQNWFGHGTVMMRKSSIESIGGYDEQFVCAQDYDLWLKFAENYEIANIQEPLYFWRNNKNSITYNQSVEQQNYARLAQKRSMQRRNQFVQQGRSKVQDVKKSPLVSVIVPTYNRPAMLSRAIDSILSQRFQDFEIIVVNDGGNPVEENLRNLFQHNCISYARHCVNRGLAAARNTALQIARGKYIAYLDDDDVFYTDHLETLVKFLETSSFKVAYSDAYRAHQILKSGNYVTVKRDLPYSFDFDYDRILCSNFIPVLCFMHEKTCLESVGCFDENLTRHEDWDLWIRLSRKYKMAHIKKITCEFSWKNDGTTMSSRSRTEFRRTYESVCEKYKEFCINNPLVLKAQKKINAKFYLAEGQEHLTTNKPIDAIQAFKKCIAIDDENNEAKYYLEKLNIHTELKNDTNSCNLQSRDIDTSENIEDLICEGNQLLEIGDLKAAADCFRSVIDKDASNLESIKKLGDISWKANMIESAIFFYKQAARICPLDLNLRSRICECEKAMKINEVNGEAKDNSNVAGLS